MKQAEKQRQPPEPTTNRRRARRLWLFSSIIALVLLLVAVVVIMPRFLKLPPITQTIQNAVNEQTGGMIEYRGIVLSYLPRLSIELRQVTLNIPGLAEGTVAVLRIAPELLPLLIGRLQLAELELDSPRLSLELPDPKSTEIFYRPFSFAKLKKSLDTTFEPLGQLLAGLELRVNNGQLTFVRNKKPLVELEGLGLHAEMSATSFHSARLKLQATLSELQIHRNGRQATTKNLGLIGSVRMAGDRMSVQIDRLALTEPALALTGDLILVPTSPALKLNLSGTDIDVDATRTIALTLAGDTIPIRKIFDYLRGGRVSRISFRSHGESLAELADVPTFLVKGHVQDGKVSIPAIELDLTEVSGEVVIDQGVLQGSGLSARLDNSTGRDGSLRLGLTKGSDLFKLELMLGADLADTQSILRRVVDAPAFLAELDKITNLRGTGRGKLILGDSLTDIKVEIEAGDLMLSADYQRVPLPINVTGGRLTYRKNQIELDRLGGSLGQSKFADISGRLLWAKDLALNLDSGRFDLEMAEFYPWLASLDGVGDRLQAVSQVTGRLKLSALECTGAINRPSAWRFASTGLVQDLAVVTELFPDTLHFAGGGFTVKRGQLAVEKLQTTTQDMALVLTGNLKGLPPRLDRLELSLDGRMGPKSVEWLSDTLKVPETYAIRAPLEISDARLSWQPDATTSFRGLVSIEKGPAITVHVDYQPGQLQVHRLNIKDRHSDADMVFERDESHRDFKFTGNLYHETLQAIFVDHLLSSGRLEGDFTVTVPTNGQTGVTTSGRLSAENLPVHLSSEDKMNIERITLRADGQQVTADISKLTWKELVWEPVKGTVSFNNDRVDVRLAETKLCGINALGLLSFAGDDLSLDLTLDGKDLDVATSYTCLTEGRVKATGSLDFSSRVTAQGPTDQLLENLRGPLEMTFSNGVIERDKLVSRILEVLNVTEIVKGRLPDLGSTGFAYTTITLRGRFQDGNLIIDEFFMDGETLTLVGSGEIDLDKRTLDAQLLAAPFKTIDTIVKYLPGINYLLGGSLVAIPIGVSGSLDDPSVMVLSPTAIGSSIYNLAERAITSPFKLFKKIILWGSGGYETVAPPDRQSDK